MSVVLATAGYDHKIRFWEAPSGICSRIIKYPDSQVNRLQITPDKQFIAAAGNPVIRLYEILTSTTSPGDENSTGGGGGGVGVTSPTDQHSPPQQAVLTLEGHTNNVTSIGFQKDGRYLYSGSEDGTIKIWDLRNPHYSKSFQVGSAVHSVTLRTDRDELISGDSNGFVKIWDLRGGSSNGGGSNGSNGCINSLRPCAGNTLLNTCGSSSGGGESNSGGEEGPSSSSMTSPFDEISSPSPAEAAAAAATAARVAVAGTPHPEQQQQQQVNNDRVSLADGTNNSCSDDNNNETENKNRKTTSTATSTTSTQRRRQQYYSEGPAPIQAVDISEDSRTLVAISNHGTVFVWDPTASSAAMAAAAAAARPSLSPAVDDDENMNGDHNDVERHRTNMNGGDDEDDEEAAAAAAMATTGSLLRPITKFRAHAPGTFCLHGKIAPDCRHLVTTGSDGMAKLWDTTTWELTQSLVPPMHHHHHASNGGGPQHRTTTRTTNSWVWDAAFCADSSYLMTASSDHVARLWNLRTGDVVRQYGHQSAVTCVALNDSSV